jgi:penicillin-insensitive murein endopeptidase
MQTLVDIGARQRQRSHGITTKASLMLIRRLFAAIIVLAAIAAGGLAAYAAWANIEGSRRSRCHGTTARGWLEAGRRLPHSGENFRAYSTTGYLLGRTFVHGTIRDAMRDAYASLAKEHPELRFIYAESSWPWGGSFQPHRTHSNGTAVDFHVPVRSADGAVAEVPTAPWNLFGYANSFDRTGRSGSYRIDFEAMALHLQALARAARGHGIGIRRVIFDTDLQPLLFATEHGGQLRRQMSFNKTQSWVRHDEHYHVDFDVSCD